MTEDSDKNGMEKAISLSDRTVLASPIHKKPIGSAKLRSIAMALSPKNRLADDPMIAVLPKDHPLADAKEFPLDRCEQEEFIMPAMGKDEDVMKMLNKYDIVPNIVYSTNESFSAWALIENGLGISITNELLMHGWDCDVAKIPVSPPEKITLGMILPSVKHASPAVKRFVKYAVSELKQL